MLMSRTGAVSVGSVKRWLAARANEEDRLVAGKPQKTHDCYVQQS